MGEIDNGTPSRHCGLKAGHPKHQNIMPADGTYCDGVPPLEDFLELTVRVPLVAYLSLVEYPDHAAALEAILEEGLGTYVWDEIDSARTKVLLRLRAKGEDRVYPLRQIPNGIGMEVAHEAQHESSGS